MNPSSFVGLSLVLLIPVFAGCSTMQSGGGPIYGRAETGSRSWNAQTPNPIGGVDHARIEYARFPDGGVILLWTDLKSGGAQTQSLQGSDGLSLQGTFESADLKAPIKFDCKTDGRAGSISINDVPYDLANGGVFLISTKEDAPTVKQLKRNARKLKFDEENLKAWARLDPEISAFFSGSAVAQKVSASPGH